MVDFLVAADDRTGALEVAGLSADAGAGSVLVVTDLAAMAPWGGAVAVVDLDSRHRPVADAAARASAVDRGGCAPAIGHKIDSTLRGNWASEVLARSSSTGRRMLVVPAFPALGRLCLDGVVRSDGVPVADGPAGHDPLSPVRSSRPADHLIAAGCEEVDELRGSEDVARWASGTGRVAVCDARADDDLRTIAAAWRAHAPEMLFAGAGAAVAAAVGSITSTTPPDDTPRLTAPVLVVCGSLHSVARAQLAVLRTERPDIEILTTSASTDPLGARDVAAALARRTRERLLDGDHHTVVILGGDTAAAVLGPGPVLVGGTAAIGLPWLRRSDRSGPLFLTRSGGFGDERALVELLEEVLPE